MLELTITHTIESEDEVRELYLRRLIALDWRCEGAGFDRFERSGNRAARQQFELLREACADGAAVIAHYPGVISGAERVIGCIEPGTPALNVNDLYCLPLSRARVVDIAGTTLAGIAPRQCTVQRCGNRTRGELATLARAA